MSRSVRTGCRREDRWHRQGAVGATRAVAAPDELEEISDEPYDESMWSDAEHEGFASAPRESPRTLTRRKPARMSTGVMGPGRARVQTKTLRQDRWWLPPLATFVVFTAFVVYATWRAFAGATTTRRRTSRRSTRRASPTTASSGSSDFGQPFSWWQLSPALLILIFPLGFRMTCYYYRKAYYRAFWLSPPACAVAEPHGKYTGETRLPLILQNIHRYFWYAAVVVAGILSATTWCIAFRNEDDEWGHMGLGTADHARQHRADLALHAVVPLLPAHRSAAGCGTSPSTRSATGSGRSSRSSTSTTPSTPGCRCSRWRSPTCTSTCSPPAQFDDPRFF